MPASRSLSPRAPSKTRERILDTSLALFNESGAPNVTTNHIADAVGISPGNLYYHFRHKEDIVTGLYDRYEAAIGEVIGGADGEAGAVDDLWLIVHLAFEVIHDYRFIHRDLSELSTAYPPVRARFQRGLERASSRRRSTAGLWQSRVRWTPRPRKHARWRSICRSSPPIG